MAHLAFIGTGLLGSGMVENFIKKGHTVTVWNRTEAKAKALEPLGARVAAAPEAAVAGAERVHVTLSDDAAVDPLVDRLAAVIAPGAWIIDHTTTSPDGTRDRYDRMQRAGVLFAHAPVFMGPQNAREATGLVPMSGPKATMDALEPGSRSVRRGRARLEHDSRTGDHAGCRQAGAAVRRRFMGQG